MSKKVQGQLLFSFRLQITYKKVKNLQIGADKCVGKVSINLLHLVKSVSCIIHTITDAASVTYIHSC